MSFNNMNNYENLMKIASSYSFQDIQPVQKQVLDAYRLSEDFCQIYGNEIMKRYPNGERVSSAIKMIKKCKNFKNVSLVSHRDLISDMIYSKNVLGFYFWEYFAYNMEKTKPIEKTKFISQKERLTYLSKLNTNKSGIGLLNNKWKTYEKFKIYYKRDVIKISDARDFDKFKEFCLKHNQFMSKSITGSLGKGIKLIDQSYYESVENLFIELLNEYIVFNKKENSSFICEELIYGAESLSQFHPCSINSVRVFTYFDGAEAHIVCGWFKAGRGDSIVDNGSSGGIIAAIDIENGNIISNGYTEDNNTYIVHPDTGVKFKGFKIEQWEELKCMAKELSTSIPEMKLVGWDLALSKKNGWQVIEGNVWGMFNLIQVATKSGMKDEFEKKIEWHKYK